MFYIKTEVREGKRQREKDRCHTPAQLVMKLPTHRWPWNTFLVSGKVHTQPGELPPLTKDSTTFLVPGKVHTRPENCLPGCLSIGARPWILLLRLCEVDSHARSHWNIQTMESYALGLSTALHLYHSIRYLEAQTPDTHIRVNVSVLWVLTGCPSLWTDWKDSGVVTLA